LLLVTGSYFAVVIFYNIVMVTWGSCSHDLAEDNECKNCHGEVA